MRTRVPSFLTMVAQRHFPEHKPEDTRGCTVVGGRYLPFGRSQFHFEVPEVWHGISIATGRLGVEAAWFRPNGPSRLVDWDPFGSKMRTAGRTSFASARCVIELLVKAMHSRIRTPNSAQDVHAKAGSSTEYVERMQSGGHVRRELY